MISVTILTKNCPKYLEEVLHSLTDFDEVLIYDNGSTDATLEIAARYSNVRICTGTFEGFGITHNKASEAAKNDWILSIDSDEVVTKEMKEEIFNTALDPGTVYSFRRNNYYNGKHIKWCGWYPDRQLKLYHRKTTRFTDAHVHEGVIVKDLKVVQMRSAMTHYSYSSTSDFLAKMQTYSQFFAVQNEGKRKVSLFTAIGHGFFAFVKSYFLKRGIFGGAEGFIISVYNANTAFYKYVKLWELQAKRVKCADVPKKKEVQEACQSVSK